MSSPDISAPAKPASAATAEPLDVVVFCAHFAPHVGGVERFSQELWRRIAERGWRVRIVTTNTERVAEHEWLGALEVLRLPTWNVLEQRVPIPRYSSTLKRLTAELRAAPPGVVVVNTRFFPTSVLGAWTARRLGRPLVHIEHGSAPIALGRPLVDRLTGWFDRAVGKWVLARATRRFGVSQAVCDFVGTFGYRDAEVLYNGVDAAEYAAPASADLRREFGVPEGAVAVAYIGRLIEEKGAGDLVAAVEQMRHRERVYLLIAGDGNLRERLAARQSRNLRLLGRISADRVRELLRAVDIFAFPTAYPEGLPTNVLEAAAAGRAIVTTAMGGTGEVIEDGQNGLLAPPRDVPALAAALDRLVADATLRQALGAAAQATVRERFDWSAIASQVETFLRELAPR